jgi:monoamine oxidase
MTGINTSCNPNEPGVLTASYNIGNDAVRLGSIETYLFEIVKRQVELVHGFPYYYLDNIVMDSKTVDWNSNEWISGAFVNFQPGQGSLYFFELTRPDYDNRLYFSGEAYSAPNGWLQAALQSSMVSSNALAYYLKAYEP